MSATGIGRGASTRTVRKIEAPRPLKVSNAESKKSLSSLVLPAKAIDTAEKLLLVMDVVVDGILSDDELSLKPENKALLTANIISLCENLKIFGSHLENSMYQGQLDRAFLAFRDGMVRNNLEFEARVHLLDILELRECNWTPRKESQPIIKNVLEDDLSHQFNSGIFPQSTTHLGTEEVVKSSGKYRDKLNRPSSKNYCKEEIIIRNADSGKVMGIKGRRVHMIEQLSETIISFQKVQPSFKERLVQITGPSEDKISYATQLIEETIRNNASPIRELNGSESSLSSDDFMHDQHGTEDFKDRWSNWNCNSDNYQYKHKVTFNDHQLTITGNNYDYVTLAKEVLDDYFSKLGKIDISEMGNYISENSQVFEKTKSNSMLGNATPTIVGSYTPQVSNAIKLDDINGNLQDDALLKQLYHQINSASIESPSPTAKITFLDLTEDTSTTENDEEVESAPLKYTKEFLLGCRKSTLCNGEPDNWDKVKERFPQLVKEKTDFLLERKTEKNGEMW